MSRKEHTIDHIILDLFLSLSLYHTLYRVECTCSYLDHCIELLEISHLPFHPIFKSNDRSLPKWRLLKLLLSPKPRGCLMVEHTSSMYGPFSRTSLLIISLAPNLSPLLFSDLVSILILFLAYFTLFSDVHSHSPRARADTLAPQTSLPTVSTSVKDS
jgi:hypothetical protein